MDHGEITQKTYEGIAKEYILRHPKNTPVSQAIEYFSSLIGEGNILDIGCGPGRDSKQLLERGYQVTGIDFCDEFLQIAQKECPQGKFLQMDMRNIDFPEESFVGVWMCASLLHITKEEAQKLIQKVCSILTPKGILYIGTKKGSGEGFESDRQHQEQRRYTARYRERELRNILQESGFNNISIQKFDQEWVNIFGSKI